MSCLRSILSLVLVLACLLGGNDRGTRVICIEPDGCITVEDVGALCCSDSAAAPEGDERSAPTLTAGPDDCCSCIDIPLPRQGTSRPASAARALSGHDLLATVPVPSMIALVPSETIRLELDAPAVSPPPPLLRAVPFRC